MIMGDFWDLSKEMSLLKEQLLRDKLLREKLLEEKLADEGMEEPIEAIAEEPPEESVEEPMDMVLRRVGKGESIRYELNGSSTERVQWVSLETDQDGNPVKVRAPDEVTTIHSRKDKLTVAGRTYPSFQSFLKEQEGDWGEDLYGRKVLCVKERFPCFDSYDFLYDHRYFRWYFIRKGNSISRIFSTDSRDKIYVTEDVRDVDSQAWEQMQATGFCHPPKG